MITSKQIMYQLAELEREYNDIYTRVEILGNGAIKGIAVRKVKDYGFCYDDREEGIIFYLIDRENMYDFSHNRDKYDDILQIVEFEDEADVEEPKSHPWDKVSNIIEKIISMTERSWDW